MNPESHRRQFHVWESAAKKGKKIAVLGLPVLDGVPSPLKAALARRIATQNWRIILAADATLPAYRLLSQTECDGAIVRVISAKMASIARTLPFPVVNISTLVKNTGVTTVCRDDRNLGRICAEHLLDRGYARFGIIEHPAKSWCFLERESGFAGAVRLAGFKTTIKAYRLRSIPITDEERDALMAWLVDLGRPAVFSE